MNTPELEKRKEEIESVMSKRIEFLKNEIRDLKMKRDNMVKNVEEKVILFKKNQSIFEKFIESYDRLREICLEMEKSEFMS